jgi:hypothetical protein
MSSSAALTLSLAIDRLTQADSSHYAIWVLDCPFPGGYAHHDRLWDDQMAQLWDSWQQFFSLRGIPQVPHVPSAYVPQFHIDDLLDRVAPAAEPGEGYTKRLMQGLGVSLWEWLFDGPIRQTLERSLGMAIGQNRPLTLRLEVRPPELIVLPWEIMQPQPGCPALSLGPQMMFSRTASAVDALPTVDLDLSLRILLVLGEDDPDNAGGVAPRGLQLAQEADALKRLLELSASQLSPGGPRPVPCQVQTLLEPDPKTLLQTLQAGDFNVFFYSGHGVPAPDGGLVFLRPGVTLSGTELAQALAHHGIRLAVFNTCWGAQPDLQQQQVIPRSSLAEVLLHHGVPAVLAMRDTIADEEAIAFIQVLARALAERQPIDQAVALARQHLLTAYRFNHTAWTLPVLYQHPQFSSRLLREAALEVTQMPGLDTPAAQTVVLRCWDKPERLGRLCDGFLRVGRLPDNDMVILEPWVSGQHAEIFSRSRYTDGLQETEYFLRDMSRNGSYYFDGDRWKHIHRGEVPLALGTALRFGSQEGELMEFTLEGSPKAPPPC